MPHYQSLYDLLGISKSASADEVRKAYRKKALETHPDKLSPHAGASVRQAAEAQFHLIHSAFETLSDPHRRKAYDAWGSKVDPQVSSEESARRMADRNAWASSLKANYELRKVSRSQPAPPRTSSSKSSSTYQSSSSSTTKANRVPSPMMEETLEPLTEEEEKVMAEILQEVRAQMPPDYEERRKKVLQKKAERERAEMHRRTVPV